MDEAARAYDPKVSQVQASYYQMRRRVWIYNTEGVYAEDDRHIVEMRGTVFARKNGIIQRASQGFGGQMGLELFENNDPWRLSENWRNRRSGCSTPAPLLPAR